MFAVIINYLETNCCNCYTFLIWGTAAGRLVVKKASGNMIPASGG